MPDITETYVYKQDVEQPRGTTVYLSIRHEQNWTGWEYKWGITAMIQQAWKGPPPCSPRLIKNANGERLTLDHFHQCHIRMTVSVNYELIRPDVKAHG